MKITTFATGQTYYQAHLTKHGRTLDDHSSDRYSTREEADAEGAELAADYDPEWQKRHPEAIEHYVRKYECLAIDEAGDCASAVTR